MESIFQGQPQRHRPGYVRILRALIAAAQQQHQLLACQAVIHPVARPGVDAQFPHTIAAKLVIAEVASLDAGHAPDDRHLGLRIAQAPQPIVVDILLLVGCQVVLDAVHGIFVY